MDSNQDSVMEAQMRRAVQRAWKQLLKNAESEPTLVIESDESEANLSDETIADIRAWLFNRR
jgi:hypothetical protein